MNCRTARRTLLHLTEPDRVPGELRRHLADCPGCRGVQSRVLAVESAVRALPDPPGGTRGRAAVLAAVRAGPPVTRPEPVEPPWYKAVHPRWWAALAASVLLALVLVRTGAFSTTRPETAARQSAADPLLAGVRERYVRLAAARTPAERVAALADLADDLHGGTCELSRVAPAKRLMELAALYDRVVRDGLSVQAEALPAAERGKLLAPLAVRLARAAEGADRAAGESPPDAHEALRRLAQAARAGDDLFRQLSLPEEPS